MINMISFSYSTMNPPRKISQREDKSPIEEAFARKIVLEEEYIITRGPVYDDTKGVIDKDTSLKWGEVYHMFNNKKIPSTSRILS